MNVETERITANVINQSIKRLPKIDSKDLIKISRNEKKEIENISYNTTYLSYIKEDLIKIIQEELSNIENGDFKDYYLIQQENSHIRYDKWQKGFICEINLNSIRGSPLFGNVGPSIPIKLSFMGYVYVDIDLETEEYGINNVIVKTNAIIKISNIVTMPISSKKNEVIIKYPLSIELVKGEIPNYYNGIISNK